MRHQFVPTVCAEPALCGTVLAHNNPKGAARDIAGQLSGVFLDQMLVAPASGGDTATVASFDQALLEALVQAGVNVIDRDATKAVLKEASLGGELIMFCVAAGIHVLSVLDALISGRTFDSADNSDSDSSARGAVAP